ncbi:TetR/AcrR family transcriptional regulator [Microbispora sp. H11081]|uniref:TetR/AcrR family transcriptional regulator n=1 Tax=Microbispora sp. H11081 TaxID=2729107 RepID=UPI001473975E|nr:TetR/AcrR family transcriptional regulator [Microbispora sp. H11081]
MTPAPGRRRLPVAERREEILQAATELIAASGFKGVTLEAFAAACGMTKAGLLHHFRSREELLIAVLERRDTLDLANVVETFEPAPDPATARAIMSGFVRRNLAQRSLVQLYTMLSAEALDPAHPAHAYFRTRLAEGRTMIERYLLAWHPRPDRAAVDLLAFLDGLQLNWLRDDGIDFLAQWEDFADRFFAP